jgi:hypothetical protein
MPISTVFLSGDRQHPRFLHALPTSANLTDRVSRTCCFKKLGIGKISERCQEYLIGHIYTDYRLTRCGVKDVLEFKRNHSHFIQQLIRLNRRKIPSLRPCSGALVLLSHVRTSNHRKSPTKGMLFVSNHIKVQYGGSSPMASFTGQAT